MRIKIAFLSYWHMGSGKTLGGDIDLSMRHDGNGLPFVPGKHLKGMLRDAVFHAERLQWFEHLALPKDEKHSICELLFGADSQDKKFDFGGIIQVSDAKLATNVQQWANDKAEHKMSLYEHIASTAIDETGTAKNGSLRVLEVAVPLTLHSQINLLTPSQPVAVLPIGQRSLTKKNTLQDIFNIALPLISNLGHKRQRGLGRVTLTWEEQ